MSTKRAAKRVIVLGALSAIGEAAARLLAADGARLALAGRGAHRLDAIAADLQARGAAACHVFEADLAQGPTDQLDLARIARELGGPIDAVIIVYGTLGDQKCAERDVAEALRILDVNFRSAATWCLDAANLIEGQKTGTLIVIGSVAGDRGRQSNYIYGAAKGGLAVLVEGIAHRLAPANGRALIIKPGLVDTPMTAHMPKSGLLWSKPETVAQAIKAACDGRGSVSIYSPWFWRWIMMVVRNIPVRLLHKTKL